MGVAVLVARLTIGGLLLVAGALKAHDGPAATALTIAAYRILPAVVVAPLGVALPYIEMLLGGYLIAGLFTRVVATIAALQFLVFAGAVASLVIRHIPADCGCFGSTVATPPSWGHVGADLALVILTAAIARLGPGILSTDRWLAGGSARAEAET
jgi:uncharacterized membrane protein YphA (DoxX/SURF4 family)